MQVLEGEQIGDNVFSGIDKVEFEDNDAYSLTVTRQDDGIIRGVLRLTKDTNIVSQMNTANFVLQVKSYIPKEGGGISGITGLTGEAEGGVFDDVNIESFQDYADLLDDLLDDLDGDTDTDDAPENIFEYTSQKISVSFTNPWEVDIVNRDNKKVSERCYVAKVTKDGKPYLSVPNQSFNGIYMRCSTPFVSRAILTYKGEPVQSGGIDVAVWDADFSDLCQGAGNPDSDPYEGPKIAPSTTVVPPSESMTVIQGVDSDNNPISYVDIPLYATQDQNAVRLYVKGTHAGYSTVKDIYILFQNILKIDIDAENPKVDGVDLAEQQSTVYIVHPDHPNYRTNAYDKSFITYPPNDTVVKWKLSPVKSDTNRTIFSIDDIPIPNGVYSGTINGTARNVFIGPIPKPTAEEVKLLKEDEPAIDETHNLTASVTYNGLSVEARQYVSIFAWGFDVVEFDARFMMEVTTGWMNQKNNKFWSDGTDYKTIRICRNPAGDDASSFASHSAFISCSPNDFSGGVELNYGQIVKITTANDCEIVHGDVSELEDPSTGYKYLEINEDGMSSLGEAYIQLEADQDITTFYIRSNSFTHGFTCGSQDPECDWDAIVNKVCLELKPSDGINQCDTPLGNSFVSGSTTMFFAGKPIVLLGGGSESQGVPPCPLCFREPLAIKEVYKKVVNYYYEVDEVDPSNTGWKPIYIDVNRSDFLDEDNETYLKSNSDVEIKVEVTWRGDPVPDGTKVFVTIGANANVLSHFIAESTSVDTYTDPEDGKSYAIVRISPSRIPDTTITEAVSIYAKYDEKNEIDREVELTYSLNLVHQENVPEIPENPEEWENPSDPEIPLSPFSNTMERFNVVSGEWSYANEMRDSRGDAFIATVDNKIYVIGGVTNNNLAISSSNERYDPCSNEWEHMSKDGFTPRFGGTTVVNGSYIYCIGGIESDGSGVEVSGAVERYDTDNDQWDIMASMPVINEGSQFEDRLYVAYGTSKLANTDTQIYILSGGKELSNGSSNIYFTEMNNRILRYDIAGDDWDYSRYLYTDELLKYQTISPLSIYNDANQEITVFNGAIPDGDELIYPIEAYKISTANDFDLVAPARYVLTDNSTFTELPFKKNSSSMVKVNGVDKYYIFGGSGEEAGSLDIVEILTENSGSYDYESSYNDISSVDPMVTGKNGHGVAVAYSHETFEDPSSTSDPSCEEGTIEYIYVIGGFYICKG